jgi:hypothetical protein
MRKTAITAAIIVLLAVGAYMVWQGNKDDSGNSVTPNPTPTMTPNPSPVPTPDPTPAGSDYSGQLKTHTGGGISVQYPSSWVVTVPNGGSEYIVSFASPTTKKNMDAGTSAYGSDLYIERMAEINEAAFPKGESITVGGKSAYRTTISGNYTTEGVIVKHNGFYVISFQPGMSKNLQDEILKHITFTN